MEGTLESLHQRPRRAGKQAAPDVRVQRKQKYIQSVFSEEVCTHGPPSHHGNREKKSSAASFKLISIFAEKKREEVCKSKYLIQIRSSAEGFSPPGVPEGMRSWEARGTLSVCGDS